MKTKSFSFIHVFTPIVLLAILSGCVTPFSAPTAIPTPSNTSIPTQTLIPTSTSTATQVPTATATLIVEKDLQPAFVEKISQTYENVEINLSIITDESMKGFSPHIEKVYINPHFSNSNGENSKEALAHFVALTLYKKWQLNQKLKKSGFDMDFDSYLQLWSQAQTSNDPIDWEKVQLDNVWANDLNDGNGYKQQNYTVWPMYTGDLDQIPKDILAMSEISVVIRRVSKKNITLFSVNPLGIGTNIDGNTLYIYYVWGPNPNEGYQTGGWTFTKTLVFSMVWLIKNSGNKPILETNRELSILINHDPNPGNCCFRTALKIDPTTRYESNYNP